MTTACVHKAFSIQDRYPLLPNLLRSAVAMLRPLPIKKGTGGHSHTPGRGPFGVAQDAAALPSALPARRYFTPATADGPRRNFASARGVVRDDSRSCAGASAARTRSTKGPRKNSEVARRDCPSDSVLGGHATRDGRATPLPNPLPRGARGQVGVELAALCVGEGS